MTDDTKQDAEPAEVNDEPREDEAHAPDAEPETRAAAEAKPNRRNVILALATGLSAGLAFGAGAGAGGMYLWGPRRRRAGGPRGPELTRTYVEIAPWNPRRGPNPTKVTIVEFSDFQ